MSLHPKSSLQLTSISTPSIAVKKTLTILVVDDSPVERARLRHLLELESYRVLEARNQLESLELANREDIDLVLLDAPMHEIDGFESIRMLRQSSEFSDKAIVAMISIDGDDQVTEAITSGANDYIGKPVNRSVLAARIRSQMLAKESQKALRESEERYALVSRGTNDGIWDWNLLTGDLYLSPRWRAMVGREDPEWHPQGAEWIDLVYQDDRKRVLSDLESHLCGESSFFETELRMQGKNQSYRWMLCRGLAVKDISGVASRIAGSLTDITEGKVADALTGLPNRMLFRDRIERCIEQIARRQTRPFAVIYADIDDFKLINDQYGHDAGDAFLVSVASRIESVLRKSDAVLARLGGDEFGILLETVCNEEDAIRVAKRIHEKLSLPIVVGEREIMTRASMGIVIANSVEQDSKEACFTAEKLLTQADTAMYLAKSQSDCPYCVFNDKMTIESTVRLELGSELRHAIERDELSLHYQPIVDLETSTTFGFEALVRWHHPVQGIVSPSVFIPIAESKGMIVEIGEWVLRRACQQAEQWRNKFERELVISVNVSMRQLASKGFVETVVDALQTTRLPPKCLKLEVTESLLMQQPAETLSKLHALRESGVTIAIDDFGTGYSSLSYLHQMPLDVLKIDRSFVNGMFDSGKHLAIVRAILALATSLQLKVIAEGVETIEQLQQLQVLGCDMVQGYFFSRPLAASDAAELLVRNWEWPKAEVCSLFLPSDRTRQLLTQRPEGKYTIGLL